MSHLFNNNIDHGEKNNKTKNKYKLNVATDHNFLFWIKQNNNKKLTNAVKEVTLTAVLCYF